jgi:hypothetical protein
VRLSRLRLTILVAALTSVSLAATTSHARYRAALGPQQCCKTQCKHHHGPRAAEAKRCCSTHLAVLTQATSGGSSPDAVALPGLIPAPNPPRVPAHHSACAPEVLGSRSPPLTLVAQHTSLLR